MRKLFLLCLLLAGVVAKHTEKDTPECMWLDYLRHDRTSAWEFQAQPNRHMVSVPVGICMVSATVCIKLTIPTSDPIDVDRLTADKAQGQSHQDGGGHPAGAI
jgi:hypothetical protein